MKTLLCDLGGTNCRLGFALNGKVIEQSIHRFENSLFATFSDLLKHYLSGEKDAPGAVIVALAAPVGGDAISLTNLNWKIDRYEIMRSTMSNDVYFMNDFEALGYALMRPQDLTTKTLQTGSFVEGGQRLVLGAGTGFNCALLLPEGNVVKCEAGHSTFVCETEIDQALQDHFSKKFGRCSNDRVLSGSGLIELYRLICHLNGCSPKCESSEQLIQLANASADTSERQACEEFSRILGRCVGDLALVFHAEGGIYLSGGVTRALETFFNSPKSKFFEAFRNKGRMQESMNKLPLHVIMDDNAALYGCANLHNH